MNIDFLPELDGVEVLNKELNPLGYDPLEYPTIQDILCSPEFNSAKVHGIDLRGLSKNGVLVKDPMQKYLDKKSNSSSSLKEVLKTPFHYKFHTEMRQKETPKGHFELGTFAHMAFLEPELFDNVIIEPNYSLSTTEGVTSMIRFYEKVNNSGELDLSKYKIQGLREYLQELKSECTHQTIQREHQDIIDIVRYNYQSYGGGIIPRLLKGATSETSFYGNDADTSLPVKIRPDFFNIKENIGVDAIISFKTTSSQSLGKFIYDSAKFQYELSEGMYLDVASQITGRKFNTTIMIMLQTVPPYLPAVFIWSPDDLQNGKYKYRMAINTVKECLDKLSFPGYDASAESGNYGIIELKQPDWAMKEIHPIDLED